MTEETGALLYVVADGTVLLERSIGLILLDEFGAFSIYCGGEYLSPLPIGHNGGIDGTDFIGYLTSIDNDCTSAVGDMSIGLF